MSGQIGWSGNRREYLGIRSFYWRGLQISRTSHIAVGKECNYVAKDTKPVTKEEIASVSVKSLQAYAGGQDHASS